ncbi:MAG: YggS family pyridoxal phosphate-dependent enzyme [Cohaesibacter sp.]|jgi:pyridoxal phosphate enzyme (YggS family)|nr:YggS family pyridoxal phosphate-dependent enzyme [Cohaesibacter sp.]
MGIKTQLGQVQDDIGKAEKEAGRDEGSVTLIAVSKTFDADHIRPALQVGHRVFGENRVQEAKGKWPELLEEFPDTQLHLIGPLQSNKSKEAVALFDVIHTVDRPKIARAIRLEMEKQNRNLDLFVQINTGDEPQKAGISVQDADDFIAFCRNELALPIKGLMCIPPFDEDPSPHFKILAEIAARNDLEELSMGMSGDYQEAIKAGASHVRVGSAIFGKRDYPA